MRKTGLQLTLDFIDKRVTTLETVIGHDAKINDLSSKIHLISLEVDQIFTKWKTYSDQVLQLLQLYCTVYGNSSQNTVNKVKLHVVLSCTDEIVKLTKNLKALGSTYSEFLKLDTIHAFTKQHLITETLMLQVFPDHIWLCQNLLLRTLNMVHRILQSDQA